jgi:uncharacterized Ntn-hydrolase superfamily protein
MDERSVTDLETTALDGYDFDANDPTMYGQAAVAAVRELAREVNRLNLVIDKWVEFGQEADDKVHHLNELYEAQTQRRVAAEADRDRHRGERDKATEECEKLSDEADRLAADRDRLADTLRFYAENNFDDDGDAARAALDRHTKAET